MITDSLTSADGTRYNIKADGTYARTTNADVFGSGSDTGPLIMRGYATTIGDGYQGRTSSNGPLITTNMPLVTYTSGRLRIDNQLVVESMQFTGTDTTANGGPVAMGSSSKTVLRGVKSTNTGASSSACAVLMNNNVTVLDCDLNATGASAQAVRCTTGGNGRLIGCRVTSSNGPAITIPNSGTGILIAFNIIYVNGTVGISAGSSTSGLNIIFNTIAGSIGSGISIGGSSATSHLIFGNMLTDNGAYGADFVNAANPIIVAYNRTRDNVSGAYNLATDWVAATSWGEVTTDTGGPSTDYTNTGGGDYALVATSPAVSAALPAFASMGALQRSQVASLAPSPLISTLVQSVGNGT